MGKATRPRTSAAQANQKGLEAHRLATRDRAELEPRLGAGVIDGLAADLAALGMVVPGALQERAEKKAATQGQYGALEDLHRMISAIRTSVVNSDLPKSAQKSWAIGQPVQKRIAKSVISAGEQIAARVDAAPEEARAIGVLPADQAALKASIAAARGADDSQEAKKISAKAATRTRDETLTRISAAAKRIASVGLLAFRTSPTKLAEYEALLSGAPRKRGTTSPPPAPTP
jgi:hypothetical protein